MEEIESVKNVKRDIKPACVACLFVIQIVQAQKLNCTVSYNGMIGLLSIVARSTCVLTQ